MWCSQDLRVNDAPLAGCRNDFSLSLHTCCLKATLPKLNGCCGHNCGARPCTVSAARNVMQRWPEAKTTVQFAQLVFWIKRNRAPLSCHCSCRNTLRMEVLHGRWTYSDDWKIVPDTVVPTLHWFLHWPTILKGQGNLTAVERQRHAPWGAREGHRGQSLRCFSDFPRRNRNYRWCSTLGDSLNQNGVVEKFHVQFISTMLSARRSATSTVGSRTRSSQM